MRLLLANPSGFGSPSDFVARGVFRLLRARLRGVWFGAQAIAFVRRLGGIEPRFVTTTTFNGVKARLEA